jgi:hypothetical protein
MSNDILKLDHDSYLAFFRRRALAVRFRLAKRPVRAAVSGRPIFRGVQD